MANGDGGDFAHYLRDTSGKWQQVTHFEDGVKHVRFGRDHSLYMLSLKDAPRGKVLRLALNTPELSKATIVAPEAKGVVQEFAPADDGLYVSYLQGGPSELVYFPHGSTHPKEISILPISSVSGLQCWQGNELVFGNASYHPAPRTRAVKSL